MKYSIFKEGYDQMFEGSKKMPITKLMRDAKLTTAKKAVVVSQDSDGYPVFEEHGVLMQVIIQDVYDYYDSQEQEHYELSLTGGG